MPSRRYSGACARSFFAPERVKQALAYRLLRGRTRSPALWPRRLSRPGSRTTIAARKIRGDGGSSQSMIRITTVDAGPSEPAPIGVAALSADSRS